MDPGGAFGGPLITSVGRVSGRVGDRAGTRVGTIHWYLELTGRGSTVIKRIASSSYPQSTRAPVRDRKLESAPYVPRPTWPPVYLSLTFAAAVAMAEADHLIGDVRDLSGASWSFTGVFGPERAFYPPGGGSVVLHPAREDRASGLRAGTLGTPSPGRRWRWRWRRRGRLRLPAVDGKWPHRPGEVRVRGGDVRRERSGCGPHDRETAGDKS